MAIPVASETEAEAPHEPKLQKVEAKASHIAGRLQAIGCGFGGLSMFRNCSNFQIHRFACFLGHFVWGSAQIDINDASVWPAKPRNKGNRKSAAISGASLSNQTQRLPVLIRA